MDEAELGLGRRYAPDARDNAYPMRAAIGDTSRLVLPKSRHWWAGETLDQGPTSSCVGHAWRGFLSCAPLKTRTGPDAFEIYDAAQKIDEWPGEDYDGTSVRAGAKVLAERGHLEQYLWAHDAQTAKEWILLRGPIVFGTYWYRSMNRPDVDGFVEVKGAPSGGHAYLGVGYSTKRAAFRILNSWGPDRYGQRGRAWIRESDMDRLIREWGEACTAVERRIVKPPTVAMPGEALVVG
jgi:hypothetical protein